MYTLICERRIQIFTCHKSQIDQHNRIRTFFIYPQCKYILHIPSITLYYVCVESNVGKLTKNEIRISCMSDFNFNKSKLWTI